MNRMESGCCTKTDFRINDYISSYESGLNLLKDTKKEIKKILIAFLNKGNGIGNLTQDELLKMYSLMDS